MRPRLQKSRLQVLTMLRKNVPQLLKVQPYCGRVEQIGLSIVKSHINSMNDWLLVTGQYVSLVISEDLFVCRWWMRAVTGCVVVTWKCWKGSIGMMDLMSTGLLQWSFVQNSASSMYVDHLACIRFSVTVCYLLMILWDCVTCDCHWMTVTFW